MIDTDQHRSMNKCLQNKVLQERALKPKQGRIVALPVPEVSGFFEWGLGSSV